MLIHNSSRARWILATAQVQTETVETLGGQHRKIYGPHLTIVEPGLVLNIAAKNPPDAANTIEWLLAD